MLSLDGCAFNPQIPEVRAKLLAALGASPAAHLEAFKGCYAEDTDQTRFFNAGNMNQGIWFMKDGSEEFVLKLVKCAPQGFGQTSETETCQKLCNEIPEIISDRSVAFPVKVLKIMGYGGAGQYDLHVMRRVPGRSFETIKGSYWKNGKTQELMTVFRNIGEFLHSFHKRYGGRQHCDVGPQNIFVNEATMEVAIVDLGMMGARLMKDDAEMFSDYIRKLPRNYGPEILKGIDHFQQGDQGQAAQQARRGSGHTHQPPDWLTNLSYVGAKLYGGSLYNLDLMWQFCGSDGTSSKHESL